jgi:hypothetical protein
MTIAHTHLGTPSISTSADHLTISPCASKIFGGAFVEDLAEQ